MENTNVKQLVRYISILFAKWIDEECVKSFKGNFITPNPFETVPNYTEFELDELYDYWLENIYLKADQD